MATTTASVFTKHTELYEALTKTAYRINQAAVGGPGRNLAITIALDTAGTCTISVPAHGGDPAYTAVLAATVS